MKKISQIGFAPIVLLAFVIIIIVVVVTILSFKSNKPAPNQPSPSPSQVSSSKPTPKITNCLYPDEPDDCNDTLEGTGWVDDGLK